MRNKLSNYSIEELELMYDELDKKVDLIEDENTLMYEIDQELEKREEDDWF